jgi:hypothetical protein
MLLHLLLAMRPVGPDATEPAPAWEASWQLRRSAGADVVAFRARWGNAWIHWDRARGTPRFVAVDGLPLASLRALVADVANLAGIDPGDLDARRQTARGEQVIVDFARTWRGAEVVGDGLGVIVKGGRIAAVKARLTRGLHPGDPEPGEVVLPLARGAQLAVRSADGPFTVYIDRSGAELLREDRRRFSTLEHTLEERSPGDELITAPTRAVTLTDTGGATEVTADDGSNAMSGDVDVWLDGPELGVTENHADIHATVDADGVMDADVDIPYAAASVLHHFHVVFDWLAERWPTHAWLGTRVPADVEQRGGECNAYYVNGTINFYPASADGSCYDLGRSADVVYHEVAHGIHEYIIATGSFASDVSEGSSDYIAATILEDPVLVPDVFGEGTYIREIDTDRVYPTDFSGESHNDGLIWASFLWNLRAEWGPEDTDLLLLGTLEQGPSLQDIYASVLVADDDDGDLLNGTPHDCELVTLLNHHGLGPGVIGVLQFEHTPLGPQASAATRYAGTLDILDLTPECGQFDEDSVEVWYTTTDAAAPGVASSGSDGGGSGALPREAVDSGGAGDSGADTGTPGAYDDWLRATVTATAEGWSFEIPRLPANSRVRYFVQAGSDDGSQTVYSHGESAAGVYAFWIGDRREIWCEPFESGAADWTHYPTREGSPDAWEVGEPAGGESYDPDSAYAGTFVAGTAIDGQYAAYSSQRIDAPAVDVSDHGPMLLLAYERWLTVEDGQYDHAGVLANGQSLWQNEATPAGTSHTIDTAWTLHELELEGVVGEGGTVALSWSLDADAGVEFGGWSVDAACIVDLADPPGHYRVQDLVASDEGWPVAITWTQPWITPLGATVLVRKADGYPTGPSDGVVIDVDFSPTAGEARTATDADASAGETFYYAVFVAGDDLDSFYDEAVEGENADQGGVAAIADSGGGDTGSAPTETGEAQAQEKRPETQAGGEGCGCSGGAGTAWLGLTAIALARRRRR